MAEFDDELSRAETETSFDEVFDEWFEGLYAKVLEHTEAEEVVNFDDDETDAKLVEYFQANPEFVAELAPATSKPQKTTETKPTLTEVWPRLSNDECEDIKRRVKEKYAVDGDDHWIPRRQAAVMNIRGVLYNGARILWSTKKGTPPREDAELKRNCNNERCINPAHKLAVTSHTIPAEPDDYAYGLLQLREHSKPTDDDGHVLWSGYIKLGYGQLSWRGRQYPAHHLSWVCHNGCDVPDDLVVRHKCKEKACIALDHLETGTEGDNARDRLRDGTQRTAKLNYKLAAEVRATKGEGTQQERAVRFNVSRTTISNIDNGKSWTDILSPKRPRIDRDPTIDECFELFDKLRERTDLVFVSSTNPAFVTGLISNPMHWLWKEDNQPTAYYPTIYFMQRITYAHRAALSARLQRRLDTSEWVRHLCNNSRCCNPHHLAIGTPADNAADKKLHGTLLSGKNHPNRKLDDDDVDDMCKRSAEGESPKNIHASYPNVSITTVRNVIRKRSRK
jgi:DNA-binding XRE family transcriptional regulator